MFRFLNARLGMATCSVVMFAACLLAYGLARADDAVSAVDPAQNYQATKLAWDDLQKAANNLSQKFRAAGNGEQAAIREEYNKLADSREKRFSEYRNATLAAYQAAPGDDAEIEATLVRMCADAVRRDEYDSALELAMPLIEHDTKSHEIYNFAGIAAYSLDRFDDANTWLTKANKSGKLNRAGEKCLEDVLDAKERWKSEQVIREKERVADDLPRVKLHTSRGDVIVELFENEAPETVGNFISLVELGFYNGTVFHRVLPGFMAQGGDPTGTGSGGPGYKIFCECDKPTHRNHFRGTLSMAHAGVNTGGSQFFLTFRPTPHLDPMHTVFGRVIEGFDVLPKLTRRDPQSANPTEPDKIISAEVLRKRDHEYKPRKMQ